MKRFLFSGTRILDRIIVYGYRNVQYELKDMLKKYNIRLRVINRLEISNPRRNSYDKDNVS